MKLMSEEASMDLPDELVEKIVAKLPFPHIFKARGLSKSWLVRFSAIGSLDDQMDKCLARSFQKQVRERSIMWGPFSPVSYHKEFLWAFDWVSKRWLKFPSLSFLPELASDSTSKICVNGALLWVRKELSINYIANIFTRSWKKLPPPRHMKNASLFESILVSSTSSETYKVIQFYREGVVDEVLFSEMCHWSARIYDSKSEIWIRKKLFKDVCVLSRPAYLHGVLYMVTSLDLRNLLAVDLESGTSEELKLSSSGGIGIRMPYGNLAVCDGILLMIVNEPWLQILRVNLESLQLEELRSPLAKLLTKRFNTRKPSVNHQGCLYFGMKEWGRSKLVYKLHKNEWSICQFSDNLPPEVACKREDRFCDISFELGQNPFLGV